MANYGAYTAIPGLYASASLATKQYTPVKLASTADAVIAATATTDIIIGILQNDPAAGEAADVASLGVCKAICGTATLTLGASISANSTGIVPATAGKVIGVALQPAVTKGDIIRVLLTGPRPY
jgi:hypothetical protein